MPARSAGKKVLFFLNGSRGDVQPFVALCLGLKKAGFEVQCSANPNHVDFLKSEGLHAFSSGIDSEEIRDNDPLVRKAIAKGDFQSIMALIDKATVEAFPEALAKKVQAVEQWKPDLLVAGTLDVREAAVMGMAYGIPWMYAGLMLTYPSSYQKSMLNEPSWFPHLALGMLLFKVFNDSQLKKMAELCKQIPKAEEVFDSSLRSHMVLCFHPPAPHLFGISPSLVTMEKDWPEELKQRGKITGWWTLTREEDEARFSSGNALYGGTDKEKLDSFLAKGEPPVYMGWGSMLSVSREHMTSLAVRVLMEMGLRGVVLKGWAGLDMDALGGQTDSDALTAYAAENVLFVKTAPQQWLFPKCLATVHHGGAGTMAAAVRAGKPTVITPVLLDQFDHANIIDKHGIGVGTQQFAKVTAKDLAAALRRCISDQEIIQRAREMGEKVMAEDGVGRAVRAIDDFMADEVETGKWRKGIEKLIKKMAKVKENPPGCCFWLSRMCCASRPDAYDVEVDSD